MASTVLRTASAWRAPPSASLTATANSSTSRHNFSCVVSFPRRRRASSRLPARCRVHHHCSGPAIRLPVTRSSEKFLLFASDGDVAETAQSEPQEQDQVQDSEVEDNEDVAPGSDDISNEADTTTSEETASIVIMALKSYRDALDTNDESKIAELEAFLRSIEDEKVNLERKLLILTEELSYEKDRVLRISADFDNFRKRTDRERLSLVTNAQGEVVEKLLPVLDNFDRAKTQIKVETEGEEKINNSYQSISKQFVEILGSLGVTPVETIGKPFDPLLHEAIMREDSMEFDEGVIIQEFRKGFQLGDRLLRPSMVKVSAGPGPAKPETLDPAEEQGGVIETAEEGGNQPEDANETG
nr:protein GrpE isoform X1 [Ipomoea batatas]